jgi:hypothetical protein
MKRYRIKISRDHLGEMIFNVFDRYQNVTVASFENLAEAQEFIFNPHF